MPLTLEIVTPDRIAFSEEVDSVTLPTVEGEIGILPGHIPLLTRLLPGELRTGRPGNSKSLAVDRGFAEVLGDKVSVLTEAAIDVESIDLSAVAEAKRTAEEALRQAEAEGADPTRIEQLEQTLAFTAMQEMVRGKQRR